MDIFDRFTAPERQERRGKERASERRFSSLIKILKVPLLIHNRLKVHFTQRVVGSFSSGDLSFHMLSGKLKPVIFRLPTLVTAGHEGGFPLGFSVHRDTNHSRCRQKKSHAGVGVVPRHTRAFLEVLELPCISCLCFSTYSKRR